jgi:RNA polymerase sigma factor (TIGR02999 family)
MAENVLPNQRFPRQSWGDFREQRMQKQIGETLLHTRYDGGTRRNLEEPNPMSEVTRILSAIEEGEPSASEQLLPLVYDELRKLAAARIEMEIPGQTLQATALVHEAYVRLVDCDNARQWDGQGHFFAAAAEAMRRILVDRARHKNSIKGGGQRKRVELFDLPDSDAAPKIDLLDLHDALTRFEAEEPRMAELVKLRFFAGFDLVDAAAALKISVATAKRDWTYARAWLYGAMARE